MRRGLTLLELAAVIAIIAVAAAIGTPTLLRRLDRSRVRHAVSEITSALALARTTAVARSTHVAVLFDSVRATVVVATGADTLMVRSLAPNRRAPRRESIVPRRSSARAPARS